MRKALVTAVFTAAAVLLTACAPPGGSGSGNTAITFTIEAYHQTTLDPAVPLVNVVADVSGFVPWSAGHEVPTPYKFTVNSADYPQAKYQINVTAQLVTPNPDVVLKCTWSAQTPAGRRLSRDSTGGEGQSHAAGPVSCKYFA